MDRNQTPVDSTLRKVVVIFRLLGWGWMALVATLVLARGDFDREEFVWASLGVATVWTVATVVMARSHERIRSAAFVISDALVALSVGLASTAAGSSELFHGGFPMSLVLVAAYRGGLRLALSAAVLLAVEQLFVRVDLGKDPPGVAFVVVFPVFATIAGWTFDALREQYRRRAEAEARLAETEADRARFEERAAIAVRLHDSVLQTLHAIQAKPEDTDRVRYLARRQERELRRTIDEYLSPFAESLRVALLAARDDVEELHPVVINAVIRHDGSMTPELETIVEAAREAMINAARHSGADAIDLYSAAAGGWVEVSVRDRGVGFPPGETVGGDGLGMARSLISRVESAGGSVEIISSPETGTEVRIGIPMGESPPQPPDQVSSGLTKPES